MAFWWGKKTHNHLSPLPRAQRKSSLRVVGSPPECEDKPLFSKKEGKRERQGERRGGGVFWQSMMGGLLMVDSEAQPACRGSDTVIMKMNVKAASSATR